MPDSPSKPASSFHEMLLDALHDGVYFVDTERRITYWNKGAERLTGYSSSEAIGMACFDNLLMHVNDAGCALCVKGCPLARTIADGETREVEIYLRHKRGHRVPVSVRAAPIKDSDGNVIGAVEVFSDMTVRKNIQRRSAELENLAFSDSLTGVPNRRYVELKVKQAIQEIEQFDRSIGLLMIDVDHFKEVNDTYGHEAGDSVLKAVCTTITLNQRPGDIVGRWGGEEFLALVMDVDQAVLMAVAERLRHLIGDSAASVGDHRVKVTVSVGGTLLRRGDSDQSAIKRADELMYKSKAGGRNRTTLDFIPGNRPERSEGTAASSTD